MREREPIQCGICGNGLLEKPVPTGPKEGIERRVRPKKAQKMNGSDDLKREAERAWALKIGFCEDCTEKHDLDEDENIDKVISHISLSRVAKIPKQGHDR